MKPINHTPGCEFPAGCKRRGRYSGLCRECRNRGSSGEDHVAVAPTKLGCVVRIEITAARRRHLDDMAKEAGVRADELASRLLAEVIDDDAAAHEGKA